MSETIVEPIILPELLATSITHPAAPLHSLYDPLLTTTACLPKILGLFVPLGLAT